jgi:predicted O-methyltransferase YrrM
MEHIYNQPQFGEDWFTYPDLYAQMVRHFPSGSTFVEVGSHIGKSASFMSVEIANSQKDIKFFTVDFWLSVNEPDRFKIFMKNMRPVRKFFKPLKMSSILAANMFNTNSIDFLFLDAGHSYEDIIADMTAWYPKVKRGGIIAGHDYYPNEPDWGGVFRGMQDLLSSGFIDNLEYFPNDCFILHKNS